MIIYTSGGAPIIDLEVNDESYCLQSIMDNDTVVLEFSLTEHVEFPIGAYITFDGARYVLMKNSNVTINHTRDYEYKITFSGPIERAKNYVIHNTVDRRLKFDLTAKPSDHLAMIVANLNERDGAGVWSSGSCIVGKDITISYNHTYCVDGLKQLADQCKTEFEIVRVTVSTFAINLRKVEYFKNEPLSLGYGKENGFEPGISREEASEAIEKVWIEGGSQNISLKEYGASILHLPKNLTFDFDGSKFRGETGFVSSKAVSMKTDADGYSVRLASAASNATEGSVDLTHIYPSRVGTVSAVRFEYKGGYYTYDALIAAFPDLTSDDWDGVQVDIVDSSIPDGLDYSECLIENGSPLLVTFQSGSLAGREFDATFIKGASGGRPANRFELVKADHDGVNMPTKRYLPDVDDEYIVTNCYLPDSYISDADSFSGAEYDALREAAVFLYENKDKKRSYKGTVDGLYAKRHWDDVAERLKLGSYISFFHQQVQPTPIAVRIISLKRFINNPHKPEIEISNDIVSVGKSTVINEIENREAHVDEVAAAGRRFAKRGFRDAKETARMLIDAALDGYSEAVNPIVVQTMQLIAGDERLQFFFVASMTDMTKVECPISYNAQTRKLTSAKCYIQHMTLGINAITVASSRTYQDFKRWTVSAYSSATLTNASKKYYVYAKVSKTGTTGTFVLSETARALEEDSGYYNLLVGVLNSEVDEDRSLATMYGFTEVLPGQITTDIIKSSDGSTWLNLLANKFRFGGSDKYISWNEDGEGALRVNGAIATNLMLAVAAKIQNLIVDQLITENPVNELAVIQLGGNQLVLRDTDGKDKVKITTDNLPASSSAPGSYRIGTPQTVSVSDTHSGGGTHGETEIDLLTQAIQINAANNMVKIPAITFTLSVGQESAGFHYLHIDYSLRFGSVTLFSRQQLGLASGANPVSFTMPSREISMAVGTHQLTLSISYVFESYASGTSGTLTITNSGGDNLITYPDTMTIVAIDGAQLKYGTEGFKVTQSGGPKVIRGGSEYNVIGSSSSKRIEVVTSYPAELEDGVCYLLVEEQ